MHSVVIELLCLKITCLVPSFVLWLLSFICSRFSALKGDSVIALSSGVPSLDTDRIMLWGFKQRWNEQEIYFIDCCGR